eukprot:gene7505-11828_t
MKTVPVNKIEKAKKSMTMEDKEELKHYKTYLEEIERKRIYNEKLQETNEKILLRAKELAIKSQASRKGKVQRFDGDIFKFRTFFLDFNSYMNDQILKDEWYNELKELLPENLKTKLVNQIDPNTIRASRFKAKCSTKDSWPELTY